MNIWYSLIPKALGTTDLGYILPFTLYPTCVWYLKNRQKPKPQAALNPRGLGVPTLHLPRRMLSQLLHAGAGRRHHRHATHALQAAGLASRLGALRKNGQRWNGIIVWSTSTIPSMILCLSIITFFDKTRPQKIKKKSTYALAIRVPACGRPSGADVKSKAKLKPLMLSSSGGWEASVKNISCWPVSFWGRGQLILGG